jgi:adenine phosphoribosyltransferase
MEYHQIELLGLKRNLPKTHISKKTRLAQFCLLGDVELVNKLADEFVKRLKKIEFDYLVAPEVKVLPLVHGVAVRLKHKKFVACRKNVGSYMVEPVILKPLPHFPKHVTQLVIDGVDAERLKGKKVIILDDVVSTGVTMRMMSKLMEKVGAEVVMKMAVIKQGKQFDDLSDLVSLGELPIFKDE